MCKLPSETYPDSSREAVDTSATAHTITKINFEVLSTNRTWRFRSPISHHAEAEARSCSTSPSIGDRQRVRTRSDLTEANDNSDVDHAIVDDSQRRQAMVLMSVYLDGCINEVYVRMLPRCSTSRR